MIEKFQKVGLRNQNLFPEPRYGVENVTLSEKNLVKRYKTIPQKPGSQPKADPIFYMLSNNYYQY